MTLQQAKEEMARGEKVTHVLFLDNEWIAIRAGKLVDESGNHLDPHDFWWRRNSEYWQTGWSIYTPKKTKKK